MLSNTLRTKFLKFFKEHGHTVLPSSPVFPHNDPSILFTNAGMNQFKDVFLGKEKLSCKTASTSQKCIRAGGKHNDLDNVGHTSRHLTFFEMLGNFSFGDYFKQEAIKFAWTVSVEVFGFDPDKITATVHYKDSEAFALWEKYLPNSRICRLGDKDNFWSMADTGPCGPCSELLYDRGPDFGNASSPEEDVEGERFLEYWNLVFMEFNRIETGEYLPIPHKSVDTGAGLERLVSLINGVSSVFESDVLRELTAQLEVLSKIRYVEQDTVFAPSFRVIADHIRSLSFAIADGLKPGNTDRSYVLRKILRRAVNYGRRLNFSEPFLSNLVPTLIRVMGDAYPELRETESIIQEVLYTEEENFFRTLKRGGSLLNNVLESSRNEGIITGKDAFKLKDTYGFPLEEIILMAKDHNIAVDLEEYALFESRAKEISRATTDKQTPGTVDPIFRTILEESNETEFTGYDHTETETTITNLVSNSTTISELHEGTEGIVILKQTPFYPEKGGQIGDRGLILGKNGVFQVSDTQSPMTGLIIHKGRVIEGFIKVNESVTAAVESLTREHISTNHTACHLLHKALETVLGSHIKQAGSLVDDKKLRLDFMHTNALSRNELKQIERLVNEKIRENIPVRIYEEAYQQVLLRKDVKQFFGDKYGDVVRVVDMDFSKELCGGTHASRTGNIGIFKIIKENGVAAGVRRIEAITGKRVEEMIDDDATLLNAIASALYVPIDKAHDKIKTILQEIKDLKAWNNRLEDQVISDELMNFLPHTKKIRNITLFHMHLPSDKITLLQKYANLLHASQTQDIISLFSSDGKDNKSIVLARISDNLVEQGFDANALLEHLLDRYQGKWGGKKQTARGSCSQLNTKILSELMEKWIATP